MIEGYQAKINRKALGLTMMAMVQIGLGSQNEDLLTAFEKAVASAPSIVSCYLMSGQDDYLSPCLRAISLTSSASIRSSSRGCPASRG